MEFTTGFTSPFRLDFTAWALRRLPQNAIDRFQNNEYRRTVAFENHVLQLSVSQPNFLGNGRLRVSVNATEELSSHVRVTVQSLLDRVLGLNVDLNKFYRLAAVKDPKLMSLVRRFEGVKPPRFPTTFEALVNAFACQQVSLNVGLLLLNRLAGNYGAYVDIGDERSYAFPTADRLAALRVEELRNLGFSSRKSEYIIGTAKLVSKEKLNLNELAEMDDKESTEFLMQLKGVGRWTAEYALLRGEGRLGVFPGDDVGGQNSLRNWLRIRRRLDYNGVNRVICSWRPYTGLLYFHLLLKRIEAKGYLTRSNKLTL
jgi:DNA-3-methyladenine glycosylase II